MLSDQTNIKEASTLSYVHFTLDERKYLLLLLKEGHSIRKIADILGRSPSSVSRELKRNSSKKGYHPWRAETLAITRGRYSHPSWRLEEGTELGSYVRDRLSKFWSPECIAETWRLKHPDDAVGFSTIYRWLKNGAIEGCSRKKNLRRRGKRIQTRNANYNTIHPDRLIKDWPDEIRTRSRVGDWEGDTVCGGVGKGRIVTLVDRKTRFLRAVKVKGKKSEDTINALLCALSGMPQCSISLDNGSEFSRFRELEKLTGTPIYFAEPHSPWQRGTNENTNGLLRFFFPKGCDFLSLTDEELQQVVDLINDRPRKCLGWLSPAQLFFS
jgi:IS30 family transposase